MKFEARIAVLASCCLALAACEQTTVPTAPDAESVSKAAAAADAPEAITKIESAGKTITALDEPTQEFAPAFNVTSGGQAADIAAAMSAMLDDANVALAAQGADYRAVMVEWVTGSGDQAGNVVISKSLGNKQLSFDFVPFDARRAGTPITNGGWSGSVAGPTDDITYAVDQLGGAIDGLTQGETNAAIDAAMATWDDQTCSDLPITKNPDFGVDLGVAFGGGFVVADVQHAGWNDVNFAGGVLGATITFGFTGGTCAGPPDIFTDIDGNGKCDTAFREIYYDPVNNFGAPTPWPWTTSGVSGVDVEAVALHEAGHGLSQAHFGNISIKNDGTLLRAPAAIMNPFILGATRTLLGTDVGGHCSNWSEWSNN